MGTRYSKGDVVEVQVHGNKEILVVDEVRKEDSNSPEYMVITIQQWDWERNKSRDESARQMVKASDINLADIRDVPSEALQVMINQTSEGQQMFANAQIPVDSVQLSTIDTVAGIYRLQATMKTGDGQTPYSMDANEIDRDEYRVRDAGYQVTNREGIVQFEDDITRPKHIYFKKTVDIPSSVETVEELYDHIEENLD